MYKICFDRLEAFRKYRVCYDLLLFKLSLDGSLLFKVCYGLEKYRVKVFIMMILYGDT